MRTLIRLATVLAVFVGVTFVQLPVSQAVMVPETLADQRPVDVGPVTPPFAIDHLGVLWETGGADVEQDDHGAGGHGAVRFRVDGEWTAWRPLAEDGASAAGQWASALVPGDSAESYQVRGLPAEAVAPRAVAINTTDGPPVEVGRRPAGGANALNADMCRSRAEWGADESLRFDRRGNEVWPPEFHPVQTMTVHHTATENDDPDPEGRVRAIYRYHAVDRKWGDIGYHYLIDEAGRVYEGRWSGEQSACGDVAGGAEEFAHNPAGELVTAAHVGDYNSGNMGAALLGTFTTETDPAPTGEAVGALENLLADFATRHQLDPYARPEYVNPVNGYRKIVDMISGHRDWGSTECPGANLYALLPEIRDAVAAQMSALSVSITGPVDGATVSGAVTVAADAPDATAVTFTVGNTSLVTGGDGASGWTAEWNTAGFSEGVHTVTATATATDGTVTAADSIDVIVDNHPIVITSVSPSSGSQNTTTDVTIVGTGFDQGATVDLQNGDGTEPVVSVEHVASDGGSLTATFEIGKTNGPRKDRPWDVVVTNPDGTSAVDVAGFTVLR